MRGILFLITVLFFTLSPIYLLADQSFTPSKILVPIKAVYISNKEIKDQVAALYECNSTNDEDCYLDVSKPLDVSKLFESTIPVGTYNRITVQTCKNKGTYTSQIEGQVTISGTDYYTHNNTDPLTTNIAEKGLVTLQYSGCQRNYDLVNDVIVKENEATDVNIFLPIANMAWAGAGASQIPSGCITDVGSTEHVCLPYPDVTIYIGNTVPKLENYLIYDPVNAPSTASGIVQLLFDAKDGFISGTTRRYYSPNTITSNNSYDTPFRIGYKNADSSFHLENFGGSGTTSGIIFTEFWRYDHVGQLYFGTVGGSTANYGATKVDNL